MKKLSTLIHLVFISIMSYSQGVICIQHDTTTTFETRFDSAVAHAQSGDIIYLPGGSIASGNVSIDKKLTIIGCGYHPDSSASTGITIFPTGIFIQFVTGSDSSLITGIVIPQEIRICTSNISTIRCRTDLLMILNFPTNIYLSENIIGVLNGSGVNLMITKNIIYTRITFNGGYFSNNILLASSNGLDIVSNNTFQNNILLTRFGATVSSNNFNNNLFVEDSAQVLPNNPISSGNKFGVDSSFIFANFPFLSSWSPYQNFHLQNNYLMGTDGTEVGIYGSLNPFKEGGIPFNPHFQHVSIPNGTAANGMLNINITVKAQGN